jgi:hypothetical protein
MTSDEDAYNALCAYTLEHALAEPAFIHQHVVDAYAAQRADEHSKPISVTFALVGLYLHVEKQFSGRRVQRVHMELARSRRPWPPFELPAGRGAMTAADVMAVRAGPERDRALDEWCASVWRAFAATSQPTIIELLSQHGIRS